MHRTPEKNQEDKFLAHLPTILVQENKAGLWFWGITQTVLYTGQVPAIGRISQPQGIMSMNIKSGNIPKNGRGIKTMENIWDGTRVKETLTIAKMVTMVNKNNVQK
jgi:hypothetical protein